MQYQCCTSKCCCITRHFDYLEFFVPMVESKQKRALDKFRRSLPVYAKRDDIISTICSKQVTIIVGETGSGKTTQIPQYLLESGNLDGSKQILVTQPRRVAAISIGRRVAEERGCSIGQEVGYSVRFDERTSGTTRIKYATDGMVIRELYQSRTLKRYQYIIVDEAHERTVSTDVLLGVLKELVASRSDLHVVIMSATLDVNVFANFFGTDVFLDIPGRTFPVTHHYLARAANDFQEAALCAAMQVHVTSPPGDMMVFLTGQEDIGHVAEELRVQASALPQGCLGMLVLPLYSALTFEEQQAVFAPTPDGVRKIVLATNIAEASITVPGLKYVVDTGLVKQRRYNPVTLFDSLSVVPISRHSVRQRSGRAGRVGPGHVYHLYTEDAYHKLQIATDPEIIRCSVTGQLLQLAAAKRNVLTFPWIAPPPTETVIRGLTTLLTLKAVKKDSKGPRPIVLTALGEQVVRYPIEPQRAVCLIAGHRYGVFDDILTVLSMLSVDNIFRSPKNEAERGKLQAKRALLTSSVGDHFTLLNVHRAWCDEKKKKKKDLRSWCSATGVIYNNMAQVDKVRAQLAEVAARAPPPLAPAPPATWSRTERVLRALCAGMGSCTAEKEGMNFITRGTRQEVGIHPSSALFSKGRGVDVILFDQQVETTRKYVRVVSRIEREYLTAWTG